MIFSFLCGVVLGYITIKYTEKVLKENQLTFKQRRFWEITLGASYLIFYKENSFNFEFLILYVITYILFLISIIDFKTKNIYFCITCIFFLFCGGHTFISFLDGKSLMSYMLGAVIMLGVTYILAFSRAIGLGDVEIFTICGLYLGVYRGILMLAVSMILCGGYGIFKITKYKTLRLERVAFVPFIFISFVIVNANMIKF
ncbi:prepilin peptidase [Clostridium felsineum]|uniref:Uncharacterized protein n=1 Tax=Clostridium felsineum TaxID=36839 RepID=A0A1S8LE19_9CLOT|nr:A24 family peptidase [Clostridium felsineum]URZ06720.1 hypothetical protein CLROS_020530 [Clostridium felsineum]URZ11753.1 hypothetical protein CROST_024700 [Clostridium felsineum]